VRGKKIFLLLTTLGFIVFPAAFSSAQTAQKGIQISPLTYNFEIKPGESQTAKVTLTNRNDVALSFVMETEDFSAVSEEGAPSFAATPKQEGVTTLADWVKFPSDKEGTIEPKAGKEVAFTIDVPQQAEPGGHYAAVFAKEVKKTPEGETEIGVASRVGTLLLISVPGLVTKSAEITEFSPPKFVWRGPVDLKMKVQNTGSVHYDSLGQVVLKPLWGKGSTVDMGTHTIIPKSIRSYTAKWDKRFPFGYYRLKATAQDGDKGLVDKSATLIAVPLEIAAPALVVLIIIIIVVKYIRRRYRVIANQPPAAPPAAAGSSIPPPSPSEPSPSSDSGQETPPAPPPETPSQETVEPAETMSEPEPSVANSLKDEKEALTESVGGPSEGGEASLPSENTASQKTENDLSSEQEPSSVDTSKRKASIVEPALPESKSPKGVEDSSLSENTVPEAPQESLEPEQATPPSEEITPPPSTDEELDSQQSTPTPTVEEMNKPGPIEVDKPLKNVVGEEGDGTENK